MKIKTTVFLIAAVVLIGGGCSSDTPTPEASVEKPLVEQVPVSSDTPVSDLQDQDAEEVVEEGQDNTTEDTTKKDTQTLDIDSQVKETSEKDTPSPEPVVESPPVVIVPVIAKQWEFEPATITVSQGDRVRMEVQSVDVTHGINIPDFGVNENLKAGERVVIEFDADKKGTFPFTCSVFCGAFHGDMSGKIVVQ